MALSAIARHKTADAGAGPGNSAAFKISNGVVVYAGAYICVDQSTGYAVLAADTANYLWAGIAQNSATGDTSATEPPEVRVTTGPLVLVDVAVTGLNNVNDVGDLVYATADDTLTLTSTSNLKAVGQVRRYKDVSGYGDVEIFPMGVSRSL